MKPEDDNSLQCNLAQQYWASDQPSIQTVEDTDNPENQSATTNKQIDTSASLRCFFHDQLISVLTRQPFSLEPDTLWYLSNLLNTYSRSDRFFDFNQDCGTLTPLADYYRHALEANSEHERRQHLQRLGDVSIFISSLFAQALNRSIVGVKYYIAMGENAYGFLAHATTTTTRDRALACIFTDLANRFNDVVTLLSLLRADIAPEPILDCHHLPHTHRPSILLSTNTLVH